MPPPAGGAGGRSPPRDFLGEFKVFSVFFSGFLVHFVAHYWSKPCRIDIIDRCLRACMRPGGVFTVWECFTVVKKIIKLCQLGVMAFSAPMRGGGGGI